MFFVLQTLIPTCTSNAFFNSLLKIFVTFFLQFCHSAVYGCVWNQIQPGLDPARNQQDKHKLWRVWHESNQDCVPQWLHRSLAFLGIYQRPVLWISSHLHSRLVQCSVLMLYVQDKVCKFSPSICFMNCYLDISCNLSKL